jgi:long-chain acyl-CoA synthetase
VDPALQPHPAIVRFPPSAPGRATARLARVLEVALGEVELSLAQYRILAFLEEGASAPSTLAGQIGVSRPSVTALIDGLVVRGLVERGADQTDRRRVQHRVTEAGRALLGSADREVDRRLTTIASYLTQGDARRAMSGLSLWSDAIRSAREATR